MNAAILSSTLLNDLTVVSLTGPDATQFLQSQITQDVTSLDGRQASLAGYCTARGRLLASMVVLRQDSDSDDGWLLLTKADAAAAFVQRLRMFVLRAKVSIELDEYTVTGVRTGLAEVNDTAGEHDGLPEQPEPFTVVRNDGEIWIAAPRRDDSGPVRWWMLSGPLGQEADHRAVSVSAWQADDIAAGFPWVQAATQDTFIPQTLNMDLIGGISFTKGCYPGQEVVARSHYRGTIKRRMAYGIAAAGALAGAAGESQDLAGTDIYDATRPGNPCGRVINAASSNDQLHLLLEVQLADLDSADFRLGSDDGAAITIAPLPYSIAPEPAA